jgi:RNA polymerase sigma-70 factor (ECF subfamily)
LWLNHSSLATIHSSKSVGDGTVNTGAYNILPTESRSSALSCMRSASVSTTLELLVTETGWLHRLAVSLVKDQAAAEDLVHDTVLVAAEQAPRDGRPLRPWLARVLLNRVRMHGRSAARRSRREQAVAELAVAPATPDAIVDRIELQRMLAGLVLELAQPLRDVVLLHYFEGLSSATIGNRLGIADGTVRWRLKQAIDELRDRLDQRAPNRAWLPPLAGFAGAARREAAGAPTLTIAAIAALLAFIVVVMFTWQAAPVTTTNASRAHDMESIATVVTQEGDPSPGADVMTPISGSVPVDPDERRITGIVVDQTGRPVDNAEVATDCFYFDEDEPGPTIVHTRSSGTFEVEVDRDCWPSMVARKDDAESLVEHRHFSSNISDKPTKPLILRLAPTPVAVLRVVDASTEVPIAGARLSTDNFRGRLASAVSDVTGVARIRLDYSRGLHEHTQIAIDAPGYRSISEVFAKPESAHPARPIERTVRLVRGLPVSGRVVGTDGRGLANFYVVVEDAADWESRVTDAAGAFSVAVPRAGHYRVRASPPGFMKSRDAAPAMEIEVSAEGRTDIVLHLLSEPRGELTGTVIDGSGNPVAGARVHSAEARLRPVVTDAHGRFSFHVRPLAVFRRSSETTRQIFLVARHGPLASMFTPVEIRDDDHNIDVTIRLDLAGIAGVVVDMEGAPVPGADVWLNQCCGEHSLIGGARVEADAQGRFAFNVPRGYFVLSVRRTLEDDFDDRDDKTISGGSHNVRLVLP